MAMPSSAPSQKPISSAPSRKPTPKPSREPTPSPSGAPSKAPTVTKTAVTFNVTQGVSGISKADFKFNEEIFKKVVVSTMTGVDAAKVIITIISVTENNVTRRMTTEEYNALDASRVTHKAVAVPNAAIALTTKKNAVVKPVSRGLALRLTTLSVDYRVDFILQDLVYVSPPAAYNNLTQNLQKSIVLGNFTNLLKVEAIKASQVLNSTKPNALLNVTFAEVIAPPEKFAIFIFNSTILPTSQPSSVPTIYTCKSISRICLFMCSVSQ